jgi:hypothetical protein
MYEWKRPRQRQKHQHPVQKIASNPERSWAVNTGIGRGVMNMKQEPDFEAEKPSVTLPGTVEKIIPSTYPEQTEKAQIGIDGADDLYREIRVENTLQDGNGDEVSLKPGAKVDVTIAADVEETIPKVS